MTIESASFVNQLNSAYPAVGDPKSEGDDHLRLLKAVLLATFPNLSSVINATPAELNALLGAATTGATIKVATQAATDASLNAASTAMVQLAILAASGITAVLPGQSSNAAKFLTTDGTSASWAYYMPLTVVSGTSQTAAAWNHYALTNVALTTVTLPASPAAGDTVWVTPCNGLLTNVIARNGNKIMSLAEDMTITNFNTTIALRYINSTVGWRLL
jgi:hypothetical protein